MVHNRWLPRLSLVIQKKWLILWLLTQFFIPVSQQNNLDKWEKKLKHGGNDISVMIHHLYQPHHHPIHHLLLHGLYQQCLYQHIYHTLRKTLKTAMIQIRGHPIEVKCWENHNLRCYANQRFHKKTFNLLLRNKGFQQDRHVDT